MSEFLVLLVLVLAGGVLAGAEMAVVTARRSRFEQLAASGSARARAVLFLRSKPERFLASVQIGITLVGAIAGAYGGAAFAADLAPLFRDLGFGDAAPEVAFAVVVVLITYLSVVFGELVPKSLALRFADRYALAIAQPMLLLAWVARPAVWALTASSNAVLRLFSDSTNFLEAKLTREDLEHLVAEAATAGGINTHTGQLMARALEFAQLRVSEVMVHRRYMLAIAETAATEDLRRAMLDQGLRRVPIYRDSIDNITGYVLREDVLACLWGGRELRVSELRREPWFVPEVMPAERALREMQQRKLHMAIVVDEHGGTAGLVTMEDIVEELVGEIFHERDPAALAPIQREADNVFRLQGTVSLRDVWRELAIDPPADLEGRTVSGLLVAMAGDRVPINGERFTVAPGIEFEVVEASLRRVRVARLRHVAQDGSAPAGRA